MQVGALCFLDGNKTVDLLCFLVVSGGSEVVEEVRMVFSVVLLEESYEDLECELIFEE